MKTPNDFNTIGFTSLYERECMEREKYLPVSDNDDDGSGADNNDGNN